MPPAPRTQKESKVLVRNRSLEDLASWCDVGGLGTTNEKKTATRNKRQNTNNKQCTGISSQQLGSNNQQSTRSNKQQIPIETNKQNATHHEQYKLGSTNSKK